VSFKDGNAAVVQNGQGLEKYVFNPFGLSWEAFFTNVHILQGFGAYYMLLLHLVLTPIIALAILYYMVIVDFCFCFEYQCIRPNGT